MPRVTVSILNFNGRALLEIVLPSIANQDYPDFEAIVVDDCSTDDSVEYVVREWPQISLVTTGSHNVGVAAALNVGTVAGNGEFVALLNNDIELDRRWLSELVSALDRHPEAASAAGKLLNYRARDRIDAAGDIFTRAGLAWGRGSGQLDRGQYDDEEEIFAPTAGAGLYRRAAFDDVGPFDETFFAYYEDVDWGLRAQLAGYRSRYVPAAIGYHMGSMTTGGDRSPLYYELQRRNTLAVMVKDLPARFLMRNAPAIVASQLLGFGYSVRARRAGCHIRSFRAAVRAAPHWLRARRQIMRHRRINPGEFARFVSTRSG